MNKKLSVNMELEEIQNELSKKDRLNNDYLVLRGNNEDWYVTFNGIFKNKVKLIYLDPPYNTKRSRGARKNYLDTNSNWDKNIFNTIKKAYEYLTEDGFLAISINQMELFTLKNILDEVFNKESFVGIFPIKIRHHERQLMINATFHDVYEYLLIYRKNKTTRFINKMGKPRMEKFIYKIKIKEDKPIVKNVGGKKIEIYETNQYEIIKDKPSMKNFRRYIIAGKIATANWSGEVYEKHLKKLGTDKLIKVYGLDKKWKGFRWFITGNHKRKSGVYFQPAESAGRPILFSNHIDYTDIVTNVYKEGGEGIDFKDSKKPEVLLNLLMEMTTKEGDLVMDLFGGSGTTLAVAVKKNRNCILIENNADFIDIIKKRLDNIKSGKDLDEVKYNFNYNYFDSTSEWKNPTFLKKS
ncbi:MAG: site-specific DNA-methyltransferase [Candidatus Aenigmarchaeota archaeon]|nr:site-specific DNA-methyltransferase [Candidatus Aenigmarchaeota archaeon]